MWGWKGSARRCWEGRRGDGGHVAVATGMGGLEGEVGSRMQGQGAVLCTLGDSCALLMGNKAPSLPGSVCLFVHLSVSRPLHPPPHV